MPLYLDTNVFYNAYCPVEDNIGAEWILKQISVEFPAITSEWTVAEMFRAFKKQVNLERIEENDARIVLDLFLCEIGELSQKGILILIPVKMSLIMASRQLIFSQNLYASDAIHALIAKQAKVDAFITFDGDFNVDLGGIPILNPAQKQTQDIISQLKIKYIKEIK